MGTPELDIAVARVKARAGYCTAKVPGWHRNRHLCYAALEYTVGHVSAPQYGVDRITATDPESILAAEEGICGHAGIVLQAILTGCGVENRHVEIYTATGGHVAVEALWGGLEQWHYLDPTWGILYERNGLVLSLGQIIALGLKAKRYEVSFGSQHWRNVVELVVGGPQATGLAALDDPVYVTSGGTVLLDRRPKAQRHLQMIDAESWRDSII